ncbi:MAG TPA: hemolysin family protein [Polyangiales bacterium]|nr:hemolysin family protein [Polyangiales bacterium]
MSERLTSELFFIVMLILANGVFAGAEIALVSVRTTRLQERADQGSQAARTALGFKHKLESLLATVQVGITVVGATAAAVGGASASDLLAPLLADIPWLAPHAEVIAIAVVVVFVSYLSIVFGELVPKSLALRYAEAYSIAIAQPLAWLSWLARPIISLLTFSSNLVLKPFGDSTTFGETHYSSGELKEMVEQAKDAGAVHPQAAEIATRALVLPELIAQEVMVPRQDVIMLPQHASLSEAHRTIIDHPHTRFPVYASGPDDIVGYVHVKDLATLSWQDRVVTLADAMRPPFFVPASKSALDLLSEMQKKRVPLAIIVEEQGGFAGIVALEDLIEELVGEIFTEHASVPAPGITESADGGWIVPGHMPIRELNRNLGLKLPEDGEWNTLAGLYISMAGHIPRAGERELLPDGVELMVIDATPRRIRSLRVQPAPPIAAEA